MIIFNIMGMKQLWKYISTLEIISFNKSIFNYFYRFHRIYKCYICNLEVTIVSVKVIFVKVIE